MGTQTPVNGVPQSCDTHATREVSSQGRPRTAEVLEAEGDDGIDVLRGGSMKAGAGAVLPFEGGEAGVFHIRDLALSWRHRPQEGVDPIRSLGVLESR